MSRTTYSSYVLKEEEQKRLAEERKRRLEEERLFREKARRKEMERRRNEEITAEKQRLDVLRSFCEVASSLSKATQTNQDKNISHNTSYGTGPLNTHDHELNAEFRKLVGLIKRHLDAFPRQWRPFFPIRINRIEQTVQQVEQNKYDPYYYHELKWAYQDMVKVVEEAPGIVKAAAAKAAKFRKYIDELIVKLQVVRAKAILDEHNKRSAALISSLERLARESHSDRTESELSGLSAETHELYRDFEICLKKDQERREVLYNAREVLSELGYQVLDLEPAEKDSQIKTGSGPISMYFRTPENGVVRLACGLDNSLFSEFIMLKKKQNSTGEEAASNEVSENSCQQWCRDYDIVASELSQKNIQLNEHWREAPDAAQCRVMKVSDEYLEQVEDHSQLIAAPEKKKMTA